MNGYELMAKSYRYLLAEGKITREKAEKECKVLDFLSTCDKDDIYNLFDSSAFNDITKAYVCQAVRDLVAEGILNENQGQAVQNRFRELFDEIGAKRVYDVWLEY